DGHRADVVVPGGAHHELVRAGWDCESLADRILPDVELHVAVKKHLDADLQVAQQTEVGCAGDIDVVVHAGVAVMDELHLDGGGSERLPMNLGETEVDVRQDDAGVAGKGDVAGGVGGKVGLQLNRPL